MTRGIHKIYAGASHCLFSQSIAAGHNSQAPRVLGPASDLSSTVAGADGGKPIVTEYEVLAFLSALVTASATTVLAWMRAVLSFSTQAIIEGH